MFDVTRLQSLPTRPGRGIELDAGIAVALDAALDDQEEVDPDRLRTGITAPGAADGRRDQEQPEARHDQQARPRRRIPAARSR